MSTQNVEPWILRAFDAADTLMGHATRTLEGKPLGIAADYLRAAGSALMANGDDEQKREARRAYLNAQAAHREWEAR